MMEKAVIFDFGNVIARFDPDGVVRSLCGDEDARRIKEAVFENWALLDAGAAEYDDCVSLALQKLPGRLHEKAKRVFRDWYRNLPYVEGVEALIYQLGREGAPLYLLSNAPVYLSRRFDYFAVLRGFRGRVVSGDVKMVKPEEGIYRYLLDTYKLTPQNCVFFDDAPQNVETALRLGIDAHLFTGDVGLMRRVLRMNP